MVKTVGWLAALALALGAAGGASAATLAPVLVLPLSVETMPAVASPPPASLRLPGSEGPGILGPPPEPGTLVLLATGLAGLVVLGQREFA
jgi:hypothetical protein